MVSLDRGVETEESESASPLWYVLLLQWITIRHQRRQEQIASQLARAVRDAWRILDGLDLDRNSLEWTSATVGAIERSFEDSQHAADTYVRELRAVRAPEAEPLPRHYLASESIREGARPLSPHRDYLAGGDSEILRPFDSREAGLKLLSRGPAYVKHLMPAPIDDAMDTALAAVQGQAIELALDGGRQLVRDVVERDSVALGWKRVTDSDPCDFCALLASRGTVYKDTSFVESDASFDAPANLRELTEGEIPAKVHDNCACSIAPVFSREDRFTDQTLEYRRLWVTSTKGLRGKAAQKAWRAAYNHKLFGKQELHQMSRSDAETLLVNIDRELKRRGGRDSSISAQFLRDQAVSLRASLGS